MLKLLLTCLLVFCPLHEDPVLEVAIDEVGVDEADALPVVVGVAEDPDEVGVPQPRQLGHLVVERLVGGRRRHGRGLLVQALHRQLHLTAEVLKSHEYLNMNATRILPCIWFLRNMACPTL